MTIVTVQAVQLTLTQREIGLLRDAVDDYQQSVDMDESPRLSADLLQLSAHLEDIQAGFACLSHTLTEH